MEEMNTSELLVKEVKDSTLKDVLLMIKESQDLKELETKIKALLK